MANISFRLSSLQMNGKAELLIRFYGSRTIDQRTRSGIYVPVRLWDEKKQRLSYNKRFVTPETIQCQELQERIDHLRVHIFECFMEDKEVISKGWLNGIVREYNRRGRVSNEYTPVYAAVELYAKSANLSDGTSANYNSLSNLLREYHAKCPMYMETTKIRDISAFEEFLHKDDKHSTRCQNTINSKMRILRSVFNRWCRNSDCISNPFDNYNIRTDVYGTPVWLTMQEVEQLYQTPMPSKSLSVQRDIFVFHCLVGCRVSDLKSLTEKNITDDGMLQYIQHKLRKKVPATIRVPLTDTAMEIIERHKGRVYGRLLPFITDAQYNISIRKMLRVAGINRIVLVQNKQTYEEEPHPIYEVASSHLARRTFAANLYKQVKDERMVSSLTGHVNGSAAFRRYTEVDDDMKRDMMQALQLKDAQNIENRR